MKIRRCPNCAELVHFEARKLLQSCWSCGIVGDFSHLKTVEERLGQCLLRGLDALLPSTLLPCSNFAAAGRAALLLALPFAVTMLMVCNGFDIRIVQDWTTVLTR